MSLDETGARPGAPGVPVAENGGGANVEAASRGYGVMLLVLGAAGLAASFSLTVDTFKYLEDPEFQSACNISPILSCGSVMSTDQAEVFGFPNPLLGLMAFVAVIGMGLLVTAQVSLPRWIFGGFAFGSILGAVGVHWLAFESIYRIGTLCPWCMVAWTATLPIALWTLLIFARMLPALTGVANAVWSVRFLLLFFWYLAFVVAALIQFWDYWRTLI